MTPDPLVSAIIPTRERPGLAARAIRSVLGQTYPHVEVWVVDDGGDPPLALPRDLEDPRVRLLRLDSSVGAGEARNRAIAGCEGELIAFLDDDDVWLEGKTAAQVERLRAEPPSVGGVESGWEMVEGGRVIFRYLPDPERDLALAVLAQPVMAPSSTMWRREAIERAGGFTAHRLHHDWALWAGIADRWTVAAIPEIHARRLAHPPKPAAERIGGRRYILELFGDRIARLPERERRRVLAFQERVLGSYHAEVGETREARRLLASSWRRRPDVRTAAGLVRTVVGETAWRAATRLARDARYRLSGPPTLRW